MEGGPLGKLPQKYRNFQWGGLFGSLDTTSNDIDPDFNRSAIRLSQFLFPNIGGLQKKGVHQN